MTGYENGDLSGRRRSARQALGDKVLLHTRTAEPPADDGAGFGGIILCGTKALAETKDAQRHLADEPLLLDPALYEQHTAGAHESFLQTRPRFAPPGLYPEPATSMYPGSEQLDAGATAVLTPTRYFEAGDTAAVAEATRRMKQLDPDTVIFTVPLDARWLRSDDMVGFLIRTLNRVPHLKAIALGSVDEPLPDRDTALRLRALMSRINSTGLIRTGLSGLDALAHGATFVSIGVQPACRTFRPPGAAGTPGANPSGTRRARVLHPALMEYFHGDRLAHFYGFSDAPECHCDACNGLSLARFSDDAEDVQAADEHNVATWLPWAQELQRTPAGPQRRRLWQKRCWKAIDGRGEIVRRWRLARAPEPPAALMQWAVAED
ncbi:hypothetical protein OHB13_03900 [Streptomyces sp. NBC_00440]|uniref:hypothetical protein n=1 Tax=Streptomyces sp. NBC_00440 TaxID=2975741 RepID=UPI002E20C66A